MLPARTESSRVSSWQSSRKAGQRVQNMKFWERTDVCPVRGSKGLDNAFRKLVQNPQKILKPYIQPDMTVLDFGCGPGFFTREIAAMLTPPGKVIAADLQDGMLDILREKIAGTELEAKIRLHKCQKGCIGLDEQVDFGLAVWMVHEVSDKVRLFQELHRLLFPSGKFLVIEPLVHVSARSFADTCEMAEPCGFKIVDRPKVFFSRSALLAKV
jgi:ubiquinone/menaquinone biosynthesis C-methylase UbiE